MRLIEHLARLHPSNWKSKDRWEYPQLWWVISKLAGPLWHKKDLERFKEFCRSQEATAVVEGPVVGGRVVVDSAIRRQIIEATCEHYRVTMKHTLRSRVVDGIAYWLCERLTGHELSKTEWGYAGGELVDHWCRWCGKRIQIPKRECYLSEMQQELMDSVGLTVEEDET